MPRVQCAVRRGPQRPNVVACLVEPVVGFPERAAAQVLVGVDQRTPAEERPLPDLIAGDRARGWRLAAGLGAAGQCLGIWRPGVRRGGYLVQRDEVRSAAAATAYLDVGLGYDRQVELRAISELGEDPPGPLVSGPGPVSQHVDERAQVR